jgi:hypothetical protein
LATWGSGHAGAALTAMSVGLPGFKLGVSEPDFIFGLML